MSAPSDEKPKLTDADMLARFQNSKKRPPCSDTLGMRLTEVEQDAKRIRMDFDVPQMFANPTGAVQGGWIAKALGGVGVALASVNIFGGFLVTQRMLAMYKKKGD